MMLMAVVVGRSGGGSVVGYLMAVMIWMILTMLICGPFKGVVQGAAPACAIPKPGPSSRRLYLQAVEFPNNNEEELIVVETDAVYKVDWYGTATPVDIGTVSSWKAYLKQNGIITRLYQNLYNSDSITWLHRLCDDTTTNILYPHCLEVFEYASGPHFSTTEKTVFYESSTYGYQLWQENSEIWNATLTRHLARPFHNLTVRFDGTEAVAGLHLVWNYDSWNFNSTLPVLTVLKRDAWDRYVRKIVSVQVNYLSDYPRVCLWRPRGEGAKLTVDGSVASQRINDLQMGPCERFDRAKHEMPFGEFEFEHPANQPMLPLASFINGDKGQTIGVLTNTNGNTLLALSRAEVMENFMAAASEGQVIALKKAMLIPNWLSCEGVEGANAGKPNLGDASVWDYVPDSGSGSGNGNGNLTGSIDNPQGVGSGEKESSNTVVIIVVVVVVVLLVLVLVPLGVYLFWYRKRSNGEKAEKEDEKDEKDDNEKENDTTSPSPAPGKAGEEAAVALGDGKTKPKSKEHHHVEAKKHHAATATPEHKNKHKDAKMKKKKNKNKKKVGGDHKKKVHKVHHNKVQSPAKGELTPPTTPASPNGTVTFTTANTGTSPTNTATATGTATTTSPTTMIINITTTKVDPSKATTTNTATVVPTLINAKVCTAAVGKKKKT